MQQHEMAGSAHAWPWPTPIMIDLPFSCVRPSSKSLSRKICLLFDGVSYACYHLYSRINVPFRSVLLVPLLLAPAGASRDSAYKGDKGSGKGFKDAKVGLLDE
jgi:hypothetical protein